MVPAAYEVVPADQALAGEVRRSATYAAVSVEPGAFETTETLTGRFRHKEPDEEIIGLIVQTLTDDQRRFEQALVDLRFAAAVAESGMLLRGSSLAGDSSREHALKTAKNALGDNDGGHRRVQLRLAEESRDITGNQQRVAPTRNPLSLAPGCTPAHKSKVPPPEDGGTSLGSVSVALGSPASG